MARGVGLLTMCYAFLISTLLFLNKKTQAYR